MNLFITIIFMMVSLFNLILFRIKDMLILAGAFKILTSLLFLLLALQSYKLSRNHHNKHFFYNIMTGLVFSFFGDTLLIFNDNQLLFILGIISFAITHIFYIIAFCKLSKLSLRDILTFFIIAVPSVSFIILKKNLSFGIMLPFVTAYAIIISFMLAKSFSLKTKHNTEITSVSRTLIPIGAVMFYISDFILLFVVFHSSPHYLLSPLNLLAYYVGQALIAISFAF